MFKKTKRMRLTISVGQLPRLMADLQYDSLAYLSGMPIELNSLSTEHGDVDGKYIQVVLDGWQVDKLTAKLPKRTLQQEYS